MYRKLWLVNGLGNKYELTNKNFKVFLNTPTNLGFAKDISAVRLGNIERITSESYQFINPQGELLFYSNDASYQDYYNYIQFIKHQPISLYYLPPNTLEPYFRVGTVAQTDKSEISQDGVMHCPFFFKPTTFWRTSSIKTIELSSSLTGDGKTYPMSYPYHYGGSSLSDITINNNGTLPVGMMVEIVGSTTNPQFTIADSYGTYGRCKITGTFDYIRINSIDGEEEIYLEDGGSVIANPSSYQDLSIADGQSYITFIKLKVGQSKMVFSLGAFNGDVRIQWRDAYASI